MNLVDFLAEAAEKYQDRTAFQMGDRCLSFRDLDKLSNGLAKNLVGLGIRPGDCVAILLENSPDFAICYFAIVKAGAIAIPLDTKYKMLEIKAVFDDCQPCAIIAELGVDVFNGARGVGDDNGGGVLLDGAPEFAELGLG